MNRITLLLARIPWPLRLALVAAVGFGLFKGFVAALPTTVAVGFKLLGKAPHCPWPRIVSFQSDTARQKRLFTAALEGLRVAEHDAALDIELIAGQQKAFWIKRRGTKLGGKELLAYLFSDHIWMAKNNPANQVRNGDIVLDCGAHVGVFTQNALERGASRVVAIEPDPVNLECLRRNFSAEIAQGRVILAPMGVWSSETTMRLFEGLQNSGTNTMFRGSEGANGIDVPVTTIDNLARSLQLPRVDYIKMDIEGAEREALTGALETLRRFRPRLMVDSYHREDDMQVLPAIIRKAHADYALTCGPCESDSRRFVPHVAFYQ